MLALNSPILEFIRVVMPLPPPCRPQSCVSWDFQQVSSALPNTTLQPAAALPHQTEKAAQRKQEKWPILVAV